jgi:hypothetical protein
MTHLAAGLQTIDFPLLGNSAVIGIFSLLHITLAALSVAFMLMAPWFEFRGRTRPYDCALALCLTRFTVVVFSVSTVLAVIMVELMIGLFPQTTMWLWNRFRDPILFGILAFILHLFALYPYYHFWEPLRRYSIPLHTALGALAAFFMLFWVLLLDGMGSFMLTPVDRSGTWERLVNPTWLPLALHRMGGNFMIAGYSLAAYGAWRAGRDADRSSSHYYRQLFSTGWAVGLAGLLLQPLTGLIYASVVHHVAPDRGQALMEGGFRWVVYAQYLTLGVLFLGHSLIIQSTQTLGARRWFNIAIPVATILLVLSADHPDIRRLCLYALLGLTVWRLVASRAWAFTLTEYSGTYARTLIVGMGLLSILLYLGMGIMREASRRPDTVRDKISIQDKMRPPMQVGKDLP